MSWQCMVVQTLSNAFLWLHVGSLTQRVTLGSYVNEMHCLPAYAQTYALHLPVLKPAFAS